MQFRLLKMSGVTSVEIQENAEELAQLLQAQTNAKLKERFACSLLAQVAATDDN